MSWIIDILDLDQRLGRLAKDTDMKPRSYKWLLPEDERLSKPREDEINPDPLADHYFDELEPYKPSHSPLWFFVGCIVSGVVLFIMLFGIFTGA